MKILTERPCGQKINEILMKNDKISMKIPTEQPNRTKIVVFRNVWNTFPRSMIKQVIWGTPDYQMLEIFS